MTAPARITEYLESKSIAFDTISHSEAFSAVDEAQSLGVDPGDVAKVIVLHGKAGKALLAVPASHRVDMRAVHHELGDTHAHFATEEEMADEMPDYRPGAVPPLPDLVGAPLYLDEHVASRPTVVFAAGTHTDSIRMKTQELVSVGRPRMVEVCRGWGETEERA